jgi:putative ABC transport system substrate-binding protein
VVGYLGSATPATQGQWLAAFVQRLHELGWIENRTIAVEPRCVGTLISSSPAEALAELLRQRRHRRQSRSYSSPRKDPVKLGLVNSLARPGGNLTSINFFNTELAAKQFALLREIVPKATRIAVLVDPADQTNTPAVVGDVDAAARATGVDIKVFKASNSREIDAEFEAIAREYFDGVFVKQAPFLNARRIQLVQLAAHYSVPAVYSGREFAEVGGLISYGSDVDEAYRQVGIYCGRILKGAKPADLPIVQLSKLELVVNAQTARMLKLPVPAQLLARADEVIE